MDRKTVRRYIEAAKTAGIDRGDGLAALSDDLLSAIMKFPQCEGLAIT